MTSAEYRDGCTAIPISGGTCDDGNECTVDGECCSGLCDEGRCNLRSSFCTQYGDICSRNEDCCTGTCDIADGETVDDTTWTTFMDDYAVEYYAEGVGFVYEEKVRGGDDRGRLVSMETP